MNNTKYFEIKTETETLSNKVAEVNQRIGDCKNQIAERNAQIQSIAATLENEDRLIANKSRMKPPTLTIDQYKDHKNTLEELKAQLPAVEQELEYASKELAMLESELQTKRRAAANARDMLLVDLVERSVTEFVATSGEPFKKLVMAIIAVEGKGRGFNYGQKESFKSETYNIVLEQIIPAVFADTKELPDLSECNQFVDALIEKAA